MTDQPKPCPFCDGDSIKARSIVECCRCGATAPDLETWNKAPRESDLVAARIEATRNYFQKSGDAIMEKLNAEGIK